MVSACFVMGMSPFILTVCTQGTTSATYSENHDPIVVNAEKTLRGSKDTFDIFLRLEHENAADAAKVSPKIHEFAEYLRQNAPGWLTRANTLKNAYKHNRSADNTNALSGALATISEAADQAKDYVNQIQK